MNTNSLGTKKEKTEWYWQPTDLDGDSDDNMQIPERRESTGKYFKRRRACIAYMESTVVIVIVIFSDFYDLIPLLMSSIESHLSNKPKECILKNLIVENVVDCVIYILDL